MMSFDVEGKSPGAENPLSRALNGTLNKSPGGDNFLSIARNGTLNKDAISNNAGTPV